MIPELRRAILAAGTELGEVHLWSFEGGASAPKDTDRFVVVLERHLAPLLALARKEQSENARMRQRIEQLRGALKSASGWFRDLGDEESADKCANMVGDMETPMEGH